MAVIVFPVGSVTVRGVVVYTIAGWCRKTSLQHAKMVYANDKVHIHIQIKAANIYMGSIYMYARLVLGVYSLYTCIYTDIEACVHSWANVYIYIYIDRYIYIYICIYIYRYMYIYIYIYIYIYAWILACKAKSSPRSPIWLQEAMAYNP